jgi:TolB protein
VLPALSRSNLRISRFDLAVVLTLLGLALLTVFFVWRGDRVGVSIVAVTPPDAATEVSASTNISVTFDQNMVVSNAAQPLTLSPPVSGTIRWEGSTLILSPAAPLAPDTSYTVSLAADLKSQRGRSLLERSTWQFRTRQPRLIYVAPDENNIDQIFVMHPFEPATSPVQLTQATHGVFDYDLSSGGTTIIYSALRDDVGSDLWTVGPDSGENQLLLECPEAVCNGPAWAPDDQRLVYERRTMLVPGAAPGPPRLWWLSIATAETVPVFEDSQIIGYGATWAPNGEWLSYVAPSSQGVQLYNLDDGRSLVIPSRMGGLAVWSPHSDALLVADIQRGDQGFMVHLLRAAPELGELVDISGQSAAVEDSSPVWSPDGAWLAFTRKRAGAAMGKQLWLMQPDGTYARALTSAPDVHHSFPLWSPDGRYLVFQRFLLKELAAQPSLWLINVETGESRELITPGNRPTWLP